MKSLFYRALALGMMLFSLNASSSNNLDIDGDGHADILWRNQTTGQNWLWAMQGLSIKTSRGLPSISLQWNIVGRGDFDGDGKSDILWRNNQSGRNYIWLMNGFDIKQQKELNYIEDHDWQVKGILDLNGDGNDDILWHHQDKGYTWAYLMNGTNIVLSKGIKTVSDSNWKIAATADVDGDEQDDIVWRNEKTGVNYIWLMDGISISSQYALNTASTSWDIVGAGDTDADGVDDIIWRNRIDGRNWLYLMSAGRIKNSKQINAVNDPNWHVKTVGDFNGDGTDDIFWHHQTTGKTYIYHMNAFEIQARSWSQQISPNWQVILNEELDDDRAFSHNVILRVVRVTEDWMAYKDIGGWTNAVRKEIKETSTLKFYEAAIWEETQSVHLYAFDTSYDMWFGYWEELSDEDKIAYRESFRVSRFDLPPASDYNARSDALREAFIEFTNIISQQYPNSDHHLMYSGHGGPGGQLFEAQLNREDAGEFLKAWNQQINRKLGVIDMGGPCSKGGYSDLANFCQYSRYYIASDQLNGGYQLDDWSIEKHEETSYETQYSRLFLESASLGDALKERIALARQRYVYAKNNMTADTIRQANYLYSCKDFNKFSPQFVSFLSTITRHYNSSYDLLDFIKSENAPISLVERFNDVIMHKADNRDFFQWQDGFNGVLMPNERDINN